MNEAWTLLKGNPAMRDAQGRAINHPAAMVYENLASRLEDRQREMHGGKSGRLAAAAREARARGAVDVHGSRRKQHMGEQLSDLAQQMSKPTRQMRIRRTVGEVESAKGRQGDAEVCRLARGSTKRLCVVTAFARYATGREDEVSHDMAHPDPEAGPNYGIDVSTGTDARMKQGNIMEQM